MVLFVNVNLGQRVDVCLWDNIYTGTVRFKGCLNSLKGEWVGVELDKAGERLHCVTVKCSRQGFGIARLCECCTVNIKMQSCYSQRLG